ncbi:MAG: AraC family transcriptional regulator [Oscillospiraceae bacterium]|nr:AraC family transcriptional regulator [Oscillospiraceae bacterium]
MAEKLLCSTNGDEQNISQIAYVCGFAEPLYFSRVFKKNFGCSPKNYAAKMQQKKTD